MKKKIFFVLILLMLATPVFAARETPTITGYTANTLIQRGDWRIYRITFVATAAGGSFTVYDSLTAGAGSNANVKTEGSEATSLNSKVLDFTNKPIEGSTGLYLVINNANVIIEYR